jgi:Tol biopolymer transport system component
MPLWVMNADGTGLKQLTSGNDDESQPAWSPDGTKILFHNHTGIEAIYADGTPDPTIAVLGIEAGPKGVTIWYVGEPSWSPDGQSIAYTSNWGNVYRVYTWNSVSGFGLRLTPDGEQDRFPMWAR